MKTTFSRQFAMIAALLLLCLLITGVSFRFLMLGTIESQNQQTMIRDAEAVAELAEAYDSVGDLQNNFDFHISLSLFTKVGDAEALLCDTDGVIRICSCEKFSCDHIGQTVDPVLLAEIQKDGSWYEETSLSSIYDEPRYLAGQTLLASDGEQIGYVLVSAPMAQTKNFMLRSSTLFFYVAIAVLIVSMLPRRSCRGCRSVRSARWPTPRAALAGVNSACASRNRRKIRARSTISPARSTRWSIRSNRPSGGGRNLSPMSRTN